ncbi:hypothetical protein SSS_01329 [Sarcoptes scabiei]|uniref:Uncharacterized protein n=1 Tax=Sarcoptes scabiei TaxID=52283 RepID=A0A834VA45_SARSC|nr:hypothetical protein SSS_01329 [Sarcoptes scabiei]
MNELHYNFNEFYGKFLADCIEKNTLDSQVSSDSIENDSTTQKSTTIACTATSQTNDLEIFNINFETFLNCFKKTKFANKFLHKQTSRTIVDRFEEISSVSLRNIAAENPIELRLFSFYLIYTLWFIVNRLFNQFIKIRVDTISSQKIHRLMDDALKMKQFDIVVAYRKLFVSNAFAFCRNQSRLGPYYKDDLIKSNNSLANLETESDVFEDLRKNLDDYNNVLKEFKSIPNLDNYFYYQKN